jgi:BON domain-containing protein
MRGQDKLIAGVIVGAGVMYLLDPDRGARRRSLLRDRGVHLGHKLGDGFVATARDVRNRSAGAAAELRSRFRHEQVDDEILHDRVRSAIGRVASHPGAITVTVSQGRVTLAGNVLIDEVNDLVGRVERVRGVNEVSNELAMHRTPDGVPELQRAGPSPEQGPQQGSWTPTTRLFLGATGGVIALQGVRMKGPGGRALTFLGSGLLSRAASRVPPRRIVETPTETEPPADSVTPSAPEPVHATKSTTKGRRSRR